MDNHYLSPNWITLIYESPLETTNSYICVIKLTNPEYVKTQIDFASSREEAELIGKSRAVKPGRNHMMINFNGESLNLPLELSNGLYVFTFTKISTSGRFEIYGISR